MDDFSFEIKFKYVKFEKCYASTLTTLETVGKQETSLFSDPITFEVPLITDTGTVELQKIAGHELGTCGELLYTQKTLNSWVKSDSTNPRLFTTRNFCNYDLIGDSKLQIEVSSIEFPVQIPAMMIEVDITVKDPPCPKFDLCKIVDTEKFMEGDQHCGEMTDQLENIEYLIHSGKQVVPLPVIEHLDGLAIS